MLSVLLALAVKAVLPAAAAGASWALARLASVVASRAKSDRVRELVRRLEEAARLAVVAVEQTTRAKIPGALTPVQAAARAAEAARMTLQILGPKLGAEARAQFGDLEAYVRALVEAKVRALKLGVE